MAVTMGHFRPLEDETDSIIESIVIMFLTLQEAIINKLIVS